MKNQEELFYGIEKIPSHEVERLGLGRMNKAEPKPVEDKKSVYEQITNEIIQLIENTEDLPWRMPWTNNQEGSPNFPLNYSSKKNYSGINLFVLGMLMGFRKKECPYFMTFKQIEEAKGNLNKGSKGFPVIYYDNSLYRHLYTSKTITKSKYNELSAAEKMNYDTSWTLKKYYVFNLEDVEGIEIDELWKAEPLSDPRQIENCESVIEAMPCRPKIKFGGQQAFFMPSQDLVQMPLMQNFEVAQQYYSVFFHELVHSTGTKNRLSRDKEGNSFGNEGYALEELVAELGASFLCGHTGILYHTINNSAAYIKSWKSRVTEFLKDNNKGIFKAASESQRAADYMLGKADPSVYAKFISNDDASDRITKRPKPESPGQSLFKIKIRQRQAKAKLLLMEL